MHPGKDVLVVGGTCHGDTTNLLNGGDHRHRHPGGVSGRLVVGANNVQGDENTESTRRGDISAELTQHAAIG